jgi:hypothetical protein
MIPKTTRAPAPAPSVASERASERLGEVAVEGLADEPGRVRVLDEAGHRRDGARHADADRAAAAGLRFEGVHEARDRPDGGLIVAGRARNASLRRFRPVGGERYSFDLRSAEVDADPHRS